MKWMLKNRVVFVFSGDTFYLVLKLCLKCEDLGLIFGE